MRIPEQSENDQDASRVLRIKKRDPDALAELIDLHSYAMLRLANAIVGNRDAAKGIVQDVFMALWARADTLNIQGDVRGYLWAATRSHARMVLRHEWLITSFARRSRRLSRVTTHRETRICAYELL